MMPTPLDVLTFLGQPTGEGQDVGQIEAHLHTAAMMVRGFTRGRGFDEQGDPAEDVAAVIVSCASRLYRNPTLDRAQTAGPFQTSPGIFNGWTLAELAVLHNYRARAR